jgi:hypothetical protein
LLRDLLANLWARGVALQCSFNQESLDLLIVTYTGSVAPLAIFNVAQLSAVVVQVKYKTQADTKAEAALRPIAIPRDTSHPLPYIAILMELGAESCHRSTGTRFQVKSPQPLVEGKFEDLWNKWISAQQCLQEHKSQQGETRKRKAGKDHKEVQLLGDIADTQVAMETYNRFTICVRGASEEVYGVLKTANVAQAFATFLSTTMPPPTAQDTATQHMRPLDHLSDASAHTAWMSVYVSGSEVVGHSEEVFGDQMLVDS